MTGWCYRLLNRRCQVLVGCPMGSAELNAFHRSLGEPVADAALLERAGLV